jgi:hypothetical protein
MPDISAWIGNVGKADDWLDDVDGDNRAVHFTDFIINDKPSTITLYRNGVALDPQTVRLEMTRIQPDRDIGRSAREAVGNGIAVGYRNHPTEPDFDVRSGDKFTHDGIRFEVRMVYFETPGQTQAWLEVIQ